MPKNKPEVDQLRRELYEAIPRAFGRAEKIISVLGRIAALDDPSLIADLVSLLWAKEKEIVFETAATIALLIRRVSVRDLPDFDVQIRSRWPYWAGTSNLDGPQLERLKLSSSWWGTFAVLASHRSGFVRQAALEELASEKSGEALPFILLRTTDWVEPVRLAAESNFRQMLNQKYAKELAQCLPLVFRLRGALRNQPKALLDEIERIVASQSDFISTNFFSDIDPAFLRYRYRLAKDYSPVGLEKLITLAVDNADPGLRMLACDWLKGEPLSQELRSKYVDKLFTDKSAFVRVRAFWGIANAYPEQHRQQIERALMDRSAAVQDTARGACRLLLQEDCLAFYRQRVARATRSPDVVACLRGLRAEGSYADEAQVRPFLRHASPKIRCEALRTIVTWNAPDLESLLKDAVLGDVASYAREAARLLVSRPSLLSMSLVKDLITKPAHPSSRNIALFLIPKMPKWSSLPLILLAYSTPSCRDQAEKAFTVWNSNYNRVQSTPSKLEAKEAIEAFRGVGDSPLSKNRELNFIIRDLQKVQ